MYVIEVRSFFHVCNRGETVLSSVNVNKEPLCGSVNNRTFSRDVMAAMLVYFNNRMI